MYHDLPLDLTLQTTLDLTLQSNDESQMVSLDLSFTGGMTEAVGISETVEISEDSTDSSKSTCRPNNQNIIRNDKDSSNTQSNLRDQVLLPGTSDLNIHQKQCQNVKTRCD